MFKQSWLVLLMVLFMAPAQAIDIDFVDLDGNDVKLSDYKGRWVVVNFWATWCPPCKKEIPDLTMFHDDHKNKDAIVLGVNYETNSPDKVKAFAEEYMVNFPIVRLKGDMVKNGKTPFGPLKGLPTTYMISPDGEAVAATTGMVDLAALEAFIKKFRNKYGDIKP